MKRNLKLSPPWEEVHSALQVFFESDKTIVVDKDITEDYTLGISCYNEKKFNALNKVLRTEYNFGGVTLKIYTYLLSDRKTNATSFSSSDPTKNIKTVLEGNELFDRIVTRKIMMSDVSYCLFKKQIVQFYNDDLTDLNGYASTLAEDIARVIFDVGDVNFCTSLK